MLPSAIGPAWISTLGHRVDQWFDNIVSKRLGHIAYSAVVAYENSAKNIFTVAKANNKITILDAASVHHRFQDRVSTPSESKREHLRITKNKDAEIRLADYIFTTSDMARESYLDAGANPDRTLVLPMGVDLEKFGRVPSLASNQGVEGVSDELRFIFVGRCEKLKGSDIMLDAFAMAQAGSLNAKLTIVGDLIDTEVAKLPNVTAVGKKSHDELAKILSEHDVLILPSRFDSFGMVVVEAMAAGLPAIVSPFVGSKMLLRQEQNGLIMPELSAHALLNAIRWFDEHRDRLRAMSVEARDSAKSFTWGEYRRRVAEFFVDRLA